jgi:hypothetical protein
VSAVPRTRPLQCDRYIVEIAGLPECFCIFLPGSLVQIDSQEPAGLIEQHGVKAHREVASGPVLRIHSQEMVPHHLVRDGREVTMSAIIASRSGLLADAVDPFVTTDGLIPCLSRSPTLESAGIDIFAAPKQAAEEGDFRLWGGLVGH